MMGAAQQHGAELRRGRVTGLVRRAESAVTGVEVDGGVIEADAVVVALGPWSLLAAAWMDLPRRVRTTKPEPRLRPRQQMSRRMRSSSNILTRAAP